MKFKKKKTNSLIAVERKYLNKPKNTKKTAKVNDIHKNMTNIQQYICATT